MSVRVTVVVSYCCDCNEM